MRMLLWLLCALPLSLQAEPLGSLPKIDLVVVSKSQYSLSLFSQQRLVKRFWVAIGANLQGPKQQAGDRRTPEGVYLLDYKKTDTAYYKAIHISYPNEQDRARAQSLGVDPGGMILIHGQPNGTPLSGAGLQSSNWTDGCIALLNRDMDELWQAVEPGTLIQILP